MSHSLVRGAVGIFLGLTLWSQALAGPRISAPASAPSVSSGSAMASEVYFSPRGGCTEAVVREVGKARKTVWVQAYSFTSAPIARALVEASRRGVKVRVILDRSQRSERYTAADFLAHAGIPVYIDARHAIAHDKVMVIDGRTVLTGSFNFTKSAEENNSENLLVLREPGLVLRYADHWRSHLAHSRRYRGR